MRKVILILFLCMALSVSLHAQTPNNNVGVVFSAPAPRDLMVVNLHDTYGLLTWNSWAETPGVIGYNIFINDKFVGMTPKAAQGFNIGGLVPGTQYKIVVAAYNAANVSTFSAPLIVKTPGTAPVVVPAGNVGVGTTTPGASCRFVLKEFFTLQEKVQWINDHPNYWGLVGEKHVIYQDGTTCPNWNTNCT